MTKEILYTYLGTNGTITSPVHLEDIYYIRKVRLTADAGKQLTKDDVKDYDDLDNIMIYMHNIEELIGILLNI